MDSQSLPSIGQKIKVFRNLKNVSQMDLELGIQVSLGLISRIENGKFIPKRETVLKISQFLKLTPLELDYLIGATAHPASEAEILQAQLDVKEYFQQRGVLAYLVDDRTRLIDISHSFLNLGGFPLSHKDKLIGNYMTEITLNPSYGIVQQLDQEKLYEIILHGHKRTYVESYFMEGDPCFEELKKCIDTYPISRRVWQEYESKPLDYIYTEENRQVYFKIQDMQVQMTYSVEHLMSNHKFVILQYHTTNLVHRLLAQLV